MSASLRSHFTFVSTAEHILVLLVATTIAIVWYIKSPIIITYDTLTYIDIASSIESGSPKAGALYWRLPAYPLILRAFGVIDFNSSVQGLIRFQLLLGVVMSWLFYVSVRLIDRRWAF
jgi:hypothetical protein